MTITTLGALAQTGALEFSDGYRTKQSELADEGFRILRAGDVRDGRPFFDGPDFVGASFAQAIGRKTAITGDVVLTTKGTVGRTGFVRNVEQPAVYSPQLCFFRPKSLVLDPRFFYYWLSSPEFRHQSRAMQSSTDMAPYISLAQLASTSITLRPVDEQRAIAEVLGALDDKIAANTAMVATSNELASAAYRERSRARANLTSLARFVNGRNFTKDATGTGRVVIRIAEMNSGIGNSTVYNDVPAMPDNVADAGDILFSWSGSLAIQRWTKPQGIINQHIFKVVPEPGIPGWLAYEALLTALPGFRSIAADKATTMGHIQRHHLDIDVPVPDAEALSAMRELMQGFWDLVVTADQESRTLAELRDTLLPALMDGTIRVKDAVTAAEEVL